jgi:uncharacterized membrane protein YkvA (DUF1232 family)
MKDDSPIHILWVPTIVAAAVAYIVSWIDLIPGPGIGWLDDLAVFIALIWFFTSWLPKNKHRIYWFHHRSESGAQAEGQSAGAAHERSEASDFDPFEVLNIRRGASSSEIKRAYREMLAKYHPDKVAHLGKEFQEMAHEKMVDINKAYEALCGKG